MKQCVFLVLLFLSVFFRAKAQQGAVDMTFKPNDVGFGQGSGIYGGYISKSVIQPDGKIIFVGAYYKINGVQPGYVNRLNVDGSLDQTFNPGGAGANSNVEGVALQADGKIVIGGSFTRYNTTNLPGIARLNNDGTIDNSFTPGAGPNYGLTVIAVQPDGKLLIGGSFTKYNNVNKFGITRLNADGSLDATFESGAGANDVKSICLQADGKILIGGSFTYYNGVQVKNIARLNANGSLDETFVTGTGTNYEVNAIKLQTNGKVLLAGLFDSFNGSAASRIVRLNTDGTRDVSFSGSADNLVNDLVIQPDGKVVIAGAFKTYQGVTARNLARINADGTLDNSFSSGSGTNNRTNLYDYYGSPRCLALQANGKIVVAGDFRWYNTTATGSFLRVNTDGSIDTGFNTPSGLNSAVNHLSVLPDNKLLITMDYEGVDGVLSHSMAKLNADGSLDMSFIPLPENNTIRETLPLPNGQLLVCGFYSFNSNSSKSIARLNADGSLDNTFNTAGLDDAATINTMALLPDGKILIGGSFTTYNGTTVRCLARLNEDGTLDNTFNSGGSGFAQFNTPMYISKIVVQPDGKIVVAGEFEIYNGQDRDGILRLNANGSIDNTFNANAQIFGGIKALVLQPDGKLLVGGKFIQINGVNRKALGRLNADGTLDNSFNALIGPANDYYSFVSSIILRSDGKIVVGGPFSQVSGSPVHSLVLLNANGTIDPTFSAGTGTNEEIRCMALQSDGKLIIGGLFTAYNGTGRNFIARIDQNPGTVTAQQEAASYNSLNLYPNPTSGAVNVALDKVYEEVELDITNVDGRFVKHATFYNTQTLQLDLQAPKGLYFVTLKNSGGEKYVGKVVVQ